MGGLKGFLNLSKISLGTMRFKDKNLTVKEVVRIIEESYELGIDSHHSSFEYNSYDLYLKSLKKAKKRVKHIVKLSSPHFNSNFFSAKSLEKKVDEQLIKLNTETIDVLQWLLRSNPINDIDRLKILNDQKDEINDSLNELKNKGKIKSSFSFPYSKKFADEVLRVKAIDGIISYLNKEELEYSNIANEFPFIGIRPLFAGKIIKDSSCADKEIIDNLKFVESHKKLLSTIVSINSVKHLQVYKKHLN